MLNAIIKAYTAAAVVHTKLNVSGLKPVSPYLAVTKLVDRRATPPREYRNPLRGRVLLWIMVFSPKLDYEQKQDH